MGAFIFAGIIVVLTVTIAIISELGRGMAAAPSTIQSQFWPIMFTGLPIAVLIAATHWMPHIGW